MSKVDVQSNEQQIADSDGAGTEAGAPASFSELSPDSQPSRKRLGRDRRGRFGNGNSAALKHAKFSMAVAKALLPEQREVLEMFAEREAALLIDLGGVNELSTIERDPAHARSAKTTSIDLHGELMLGVARPARIELAAPRLGGGCSIR